MVIHGFDRDRREIARQRLELAGKPLEGFLKGERLMHYSGYFALILALLEFSNQLLKLFELRVFFRYGSLGSIVGFYYCLMLRSRYHGWAGELLLDSRECVNELIALGLGKCPLRASRPWERLRGTRRSRPWCFPTSTS